jgi:multiple sugar transport system permease protein
MVFEYLDQRFFASQRDPAQYGFGPVPKGPTGIRGSEFNSMMTGIYAGLEDDEELRDVAWEYIRFRDSPEARKIRAEVFVANGLGRFVRPDLLRAAGFPEYLKQIPPQWEEAYQQALENGVPEPYGRNCQMVYKYVDQAINQIRSDGQVKDAIAAGDAARAKARIREILVERVRRSNEKMLNILTPEQRRFRTTVACVAAVAILAIFVLVFRKVFKTFSASSMGLQTGKRSWGFAKYKWAYILLIPAVASIALWAYWPLARGTVIAFEDYNVRGFSSWVGLDNFANCLFDSEFWYAVWVSLKYALMFAAFAFTAPIVLAFLLTEVPRGKVLFRVLYYLPAVLSGVIVIFLWQGFYGQYGMINAVINGFLQIWEAAANFFIWIANGVGGLWHAGAISHVHYEEVHTAWMTSPSFALFFVLLPVVWAGVGPGCLIYLAALKTIPEEIYESADIDGAGFLSKVFNVSLPNIKSLVLINFIGAMVGAIRGGSEFVLAMTGGGPYAPNGETEVIGLHIYWQAYGYLRFGQASAMAWVLGSMLVGFTVLRLQQLSRVEFRAAAGVA